MSQCLVSPGASTTSGGTFTPYPSAAPACIQAPRPSTVPPATSHAGIHAPVAKVFNGGVVVHHGAAVHDSTHAQSGFGAHKGTSHHGRACTHHRTGRNNGAGGNPPLLQGSEK